MPRYKLKNTDRPCDRHTVVLTDDLWDWYEKCAQERRCNPSDTVQEFGEACKNASECGIDVVRVLREMAALNTTNASRRRTKPTKQTTDN